MLLIAFETANQPEVIALIAELDAYQDSLYPAEARYALDLSSLCQPHVLFAVARDEAGTAVGCAAVVLSDAYGEIKRMFVRPAARGQCVAQALIRTLERAACERGCRQLMLETGPYQPEALAFYVREGYERRGPFGDYPDHPLSVFMGKALAPEAPR
ncbi:GNAT family N-acetyltransferase [Roseateles sp. BYS87W]|uniref:GNAT family N-acetyltransferase n=1 Tax=Pelomonas baiyunensis TaxID=3299026 RepID=A0ABW7GX80_9BURK